MTLKRLLEAPTYRYIQAAMLVVLVIAFVTSFESGSAGAKRLGYPEGFVAALPLVCDVIAGLATFIHSRVRNDPKMRRLAAQFVLIPMLLSWGSNSVDHVNRAPAGDWATAGVAAWTAAVILAAGICPVAVAALLHLSTKYVEHELRQNERASDSSGVEVSAPAPVAVPVEPPAAMVEPEAPVVAETDEPSQPMSYDEAVAWAIRHDAGAKLIKKHCGLSEHYAKKAREAVIAARALRIA